MGNKKSIPFVERDELDFKLKSICPVHIDTTMYRPEYSLFLAIQIAILTEQSEQINYPDHLNRMGEKDLVVLLLMIEQYIETKNKSRESLMSLHQRVYFLIMEKTEQFLKLPNGYSCF